MTCEQDKPCKECLKISNGRVGCIPRSHLDHGVFSWGVHRDMVPRGYKGRWVVVIPVTKDQLPTQPYPENVIAFNGRMYDEVYDQMFVAETQPYVLVYGRTPGRAKKAAKNLRPASNTRQ